jgi:predicted  nucleic acid-binding Zn-ribbon protein
MKEFTAVRCPRCGFEGGDEDFRAGCPACGHMQPTLDDQATHGSRRAGGRQPRRRQAMAARKRTARSPLSRRFYVAAGIGLAVAALVLLALLVASP